VGFARFFFYNRHANVRPSGNPALTKVGGVALWQADINN
jgi:hypothetical protein